MTDIRRVTILGATGSVGQSTISVLSQKPAGVRGPDFQVVALTARSNAVELAHAAKSVGAEMAVLSEPDRYRDLKEALSGSGIEVAAGDEAMLEAASRDSHTVVSAISGAAGLLPTLAAVGRGANVAFANKESLVCAGPILIEAARMHGASLLPIDSEHNAIFQVLGHKSRVEKIILTASGGPFRTASLETMRHATPEMAVRHPNWSMGAKISVDSATMMNKGLELIEASYLFDLPESQIDVLVHPQSIVHSLVAYDDGSVLAQLGMPDMRTPISYALAWPDRMPINGIERLDLASVARLDFAAHDPDRFPAIDLARDALNLGPWGPNVFNAVNEEAVASFLRRQIGFMEIVELTRQVVEEFAGGYWGKVSNPTDIAQVIDLDRRAREAARSKLPIAA